MAGSVLQFGGLISGLSTQDIVTKLMDVERVPLTLLQKRKDETQRRADALKDINTRLASLLSAVQKLNLRSTIDSRSVATDTPSSSATLVTATASSDSAVGSFTVRVKALATTTSMTSTGASGAEAVGKAVQANQVLASAGFATTPTTGTFSINGATITIDGSTVLSDGVDGVGANTVFAKIRDATAGLAASKQVTASWGLDANGRQNKLVLTATGAIQLGTSTDTSNFLNAAGLSSQPAATTITSARNLGAVSPSAYLNSSEANLDTMLASATGSFNINGTTITYDGDVDTLNTLIGRINSSAANVIATYDSNSDRMNLTSRTTGSALMDVSDVTGNFLATMKLSNGNQTVGTTASYLLNGDQRYSSSNTVSDALPGVTLSLKAADNATDVTLTISQDTSGAVSAVDDFVKQYNSVMSLIRDKTSYDATLKKGQILTADAAIDGIKTALATFVGGIGDGLSSVARSLSDVGITTGAVGTAVGAATELVLDRNKLVTKLQSNPNAVADLFGGLQHNVSLSPGGTGSVASIAGIPSNHVSGSYSIVSDASGNLTSTFTPSGGGATVTRSGSISASGTNSTLISGVVLTAKGILAAGTDTVNASFSLKGVGVKLEDYLSNLTSSTGLFATRQSSADREIASTTKSMQDMQARLDQKEEALNRKFAALEVALAQLQSQSASVASQIASMSSAN